MVFCSDRGAMRAFRFTMRQLAQQDAARIAALLETEQQRLVQTWKEVKPND
jgi:hypothetical protein